MIISQIFVKMDLKEHEGVSHYNESTKHKHNESIEVYQYRKGPRIEAATTLCHYILWKWIGQRGRLWWYLAIADCVRTLNLEKRFYRIFFLWPHHKKNVCEKRYRFPGKIISGNLFKKHLFYICRCCLVYLHSNYYYSLSQVVPSPAFESKHSIKSE